MEVALVRGKVARAGPSAKLVLGAHGWVVEVREHVELRERELVDAVHADRVAKGNEVEPATASASAGDRAVLVAELAHPVLVCPFDLRRERAFADARHVCL